jgi:small subunit ribosomal protein S8
MSCTDPIADMLTVIRNGLAARKATVTVPHSNIKQGIAAVLQEEGYVRSVDVLETKPAKTIQIGLKYGDHGEPAIHEVVRVSTPGLRQYASPAEMKPVMRGFGIRIITTSRGIISDRTARKQRVGGEVLCIVK